MSERVRIIGMSEVVENSLKGRQEAVIESISEKSSAISCIRGVIALHSPDALFIGFTVDAQSEDEWDEVSDLEYDIEHEFPDVFKIFKEADLKNAENIDDLRIWFFHPDF